MTKDRLAALKAVGVTYFLSQLAQPLNQTINIHVDSAVKCDSSHLK